MENYQYMTKSLTDFTVFPGFAWKCAGRAAELFSKIFIPSQGFRDCKLAGLFLFIPPLSPPGISSEMTEVCYRCRLRAPTESHGLRGREERRGRHRTLRRAAPGSWPGQTTAGVVTVLCVRILGITSSAQPDLNSTPFN